MTSKQDSGDTLNALADYAAQKIMEDLRAGKAISSELAFDVHRTPYIDSLRAQVRPEDKRLIFNLAASSDKNIVILSIGLLKSLREDRDVKDFLFQKWGTSNDYALKSKITHRLMDYKELSIDQHKEIRRFVTENWELWIAGVKKYYEGSGDYLEKIRQRVSDDRFPDTKLWMRLYQSMGYGDKKAVRQFLEGYVESDAPLAAEVAKDLIDKIDKEL